MEYLSTIGGTLAYNLANLFVTIGEDFAQQEDGPLIRCQAFQEEKKGQGNRFVLFKGMPCSMQGLPGPLSGWVQEARRRHTAHAVSALT